MLRNMREIKFKSMYNIEIFDLPTNVEKIVNNTEKYEIHNQPTSAYSTNSCQLQQCITIPKQLIKYANSIQKL